MILISTLSLLEPLCSGHTHFLSCTVWSIRRIRHLVFGVFNTSCTDKAIFNKPCQLCQVVVFEPFNTSGKGEASFTYCEHGRRARRSLMGSSLCSSAEFLRYRAIFLTISSKRKWRKIRYKKWEIKYLCWYLCWIPRRWIKQHAVRWLSWSTRRSVSVSRFRVLFCSKKSIFCTLLFSLSLWQDFPRKYSLWLPAAPHLSVESMQLKLASILTIKTVLSAPQTKAQCWKDLRFWNAITSGLAPWRKMTSG